MRRGPNNFVTRANVGRVHILQTVSKSVGGAFGVWNLPQVKMQTTRAGSKLCEPSRLRRGEPRREPFIKQLAEPAPPVNK